ncbi:Aste57867_19224 [Aphanomyces stellatus]|uniref:Aste57867_15741 protein n=1 Tax=Aphanomyces stellatus TaxID=120398 RepID=A0A485LCC0_9STRA|nr:hypothetical protein As57867_019160 [Aphanomyces stellatus]KAF0693264.1 hypothetical protein As57867_015685 [Aphanomyces stellatus]VFT92530.1 Aste57867_15741 [Aphanomyces stellatus]VFT95945.1 Aste57867_19224 [Aphanomyces stellatus]
MMACAGDADSAAVEVEMAAGITQAQYMKEYHKKKKDEKAMLLKSLLQLQQMKDDIMQQRKLAILSWADVAKALQDHRRLSETQRSILKKDVTRQKNLLREMFHWVAARAAIDANPNPCRSSWRNTSLLASPESRQLGKEWIMKQLFCNRERLFHEYNFPSLEDEIPADVQFDFTQDSYTAVFRRQYQTDMALEQVKAYVYKSLLALQCKISSYSDETPLLVEEIQDNIRQYAMVTSTDEYANVLVGEFAIPFGYVFAMQQIQSDDAIAAHNQRRQRNRMFLMEVQQKPGERLQARGLWLISQMFSHEHGAVSLGEDAKEWGFSLHGCPEYLEETRFPKLWEEEMARRRYFYSVSASF